ncbi:SDR family oxidoreductase [Frankia sp. CNm7]|uniref:SDR family oxidoreductase n=1 Tax=Frankia nepalensis TaxID=1836974 RepID=A0A937URV4_9ACTN|nr:SDR family oxidoreductase [Frankia nepalensis]MBL7499371.1 SDR family oxidoreductase [Frankia nepalensis]MBL7512814.1 SDR family oxidoreductase [Frankia nepalensis]MBL7521798.1 SDR family oxidoreductase [Frankia nepalensis]MBL7631513.1 SDR family oxidoreductase [Frankia nepalensis]
MGNLCHGRVAIVTGASRGIGKATAIRLAAEGAAVAITARSLDAKRFGSSLRRTAQYIEAAGGNVLPVEINLEEPIPGRDWLIDRVEAELGPVDILVNNAAIGGFKRFTTWTDDELRAMQEVNVWAPWQLARRALQGMATRGRGSIVNVTSVSARIPKGPPFSAGAVVYRGSAYGSTKAMLDRWTVSAAAEYEEAGVALNAIAPAGAVATEAVLMSIEAGQIPAKACEPLETMAEAILTLATAEPSSGLTGRVMTSLELLAELGRPVWDLSGAALVDGWQQADLIRLLADVRRTR